MNEDTYSGEAELIPGSGGLPIPVEAKLRIHRSAPISSWEGEVYSPSGELLRLELGPYTLRLPSGREGTALVTKLSMGWHVSGQVRQRVPVVGSGPPPFGLATS